MPESAGRNIVKNAKYAGYSSSSVVSPVTPDDNAFLVEISSNRSLRVFLLADQEGKTVLYEEDSYIKMGKMTETKEFLRNIGK